MLLSEQITPENTNPMLAAIGRAAQEMSQNIIESALTEARKQSQEIIQAARELADDLKVVVGIEFPDGKVFELKENSHPSIPKLIKYVRCGLLPLLVGPAGSGKSTMAENLAEILILPFGHLCFSAGVSEVWLFGRHTPEGFKEAEFSRMYREGGVFLADELDAADANVLLAINTALSSSTLYNPMNGQTYKKHENFYFIGAANTFGKGANGAYVGRNRLDAATLDRFVCVDVDYIPSIEHTLCPDLNLAKLLRDIRDGLKKESAMEVVSYRAFMKAYRMQVLQVPIAEIMKTLFASWQPDLYNRVVTPKVQSFRPDALPAPQAKKKKTVTTLEFNPDIPF